MKKSSIWKLLFSALTVFAVAVFAGCTDDNDDMGAPYLNVTPENLTFDAEGQPADEYNGTFIVETNRPWRAIVEDEQTWVRLSATEGEGDAAVTVTVPASNIGQSAKVTFEVYNSYGALIQKDVNVLQGEVVPPTLIFNETACSESVADAINLNLILPILILFYLYINILQLFFNNCEVWKFSKIRPMYDKCMTKMITFAADKTS